MEHSMVLFTLVSYHEVYEASHHHEGVQVPCQLQLLLGVSLPEEWCWILL